MILELFKTYHPHENEKKKDAQVTLTTIVRSPYQERMWQKKGIRKDGSTRATVWRQVTVLWRLEPHRNILWGPFVSKVTRNSR